MPGTRKLGRPTAHRQAMLRGMVTYLLENGSIQTTLTRAKEVRSLTEKMITLGKKNTLAAKRAAMAFVTKEDVVKKLFDTIAPEYADRNGGYTRMYKLGPRRGDGAEMALIKLVADEKAAEEPKKETKKAAKKAEANAEEAKVEEVKAEEATEETKAE
ncbi:MAG: 50S ribosomal protein L17 [Clostridia bacterium]|nr:50S ribosomal protein L17 [Clostridia bacterium]